MKKHLYIVLLNLHYCNEEISNDKQEVKTVTAMIILQNFAVEYENPNRSKMVARTLDFGPVKPQLGEEKEDDCERFNLRNY